VIYENTRYDSNNTASRTLRRSFSVGRYSDLGRNTARKTRSASQTRSNDASGLDHDMIGGTMSRPGHKNPDTMSRLGDKNPNKSDVYQSPISRRPLPRIPDSPSDCASVSSNLSQKSLLNDIYRFTTHNESIYNYDEVNTSSRSSRSRIPVSVKNVNRSCKSDGSIKSRSVTQWDLRTEALLVDTSIVKKGLLWIQQDKLFSSWKERFVILTNSHLQIFKKGTTKFSEMGTFINKISLSSLEKVTLEERRGYLTILLVTGPPHPVRLLLRRPDGLCDWHKHISTSSRGPGVRDRLNYRRQLSEYGTFQNLPRVRRSSLDESPCSSIGRHYSSTPTSSSPRQHRNGENVYGSTPSPLVPAQTRPVDNVYGVSPLQSPLLSPQHQPKQYSQQQPVYEVPVNSLPRFLQTPPGHNDRPSRLSMDQRQSNVPRLYQDSMPSMYGHNISPLKLNQTMFV